jgi:hypothetical protein
MSLFFLLNTLLLAHMLKTAKMTQSQRRGAEIEARRKALSGFKKATFYSTLSSGDGCDVSEYEVFLERIKDNVRAEICRISSMPNSELMYLLKILEIWGVPSEVLEMKSDSETLISKIAVLLQYLKGMSDNFFKLILSSSNSEANLGKMNHYVELFQFLTQVISQPGFVLSSEQLAELQDYINQTSESPIQLSEFVSQILSPDSDRFFIYWMNEVMILQRMLDAIWIDYEWQTNSRHLESLPEDLQILVSKIWTQAQKRLSVEEQSLEALLLFLNEVLPHLRKTKYFLEDEDILKAVREVLSKLSAKFQELPEAEYARILRNMSSSVDLLPSLRELPEFLVQALDTPNVLVVSEEHSASSSDS